MDGAVEQLTNHQQQLDQDGIMVGVSRQAVDEVLASLTARDAEIANLESERAHHAMTAGCLRTDLEYANTEIARLRALVRTAYNEGFMQGMREHTSSKGGIPWSDSKIRAALDAPQTTSSLNQPTSL